MTIYLSEPTAEELAAAGVDLVSIVAGELNFFVVNTVDIGS